MARGSSPALLLLLVVFALLPNTSARAEAPVSRETRGAVLIKLGSCTKPGPGCEEPAPPCAGSDPKCRKTALYAESHALVIGASEYTQGWQRLDGVREDVKAVQETLEGHGFQVTLVMNPDHKKLREAVRDFIDAHGMSKQNRLLIYFAGHGHTMQTEYGASMGYIVPVDAPAPAADKKGFWRTAMSMEEIHVMAKLIQSKHALFLFDSCFSGSLFSLRSQEEVPPYITYKAAEPVRQFITAGSANEAVPDESIFRKYVVNGLRGDADLNGDGYVTGVELGEYLLVRVTVSSRNMQHPQSGKIRDPDLNRGDFIFGVPRVTGTLYLNSMPQSTILVDGTAAPGFPVSQFYVKAGRHELSFRAPGRPDLKHSVDVPAGKTVRCLAELEKARVECIQDDEPER